MISEVPTKRLQSKILIFICTGTLGGMEFDSESVSRVVYGNCCGYLAGTWGKAGVESAVHWGNEVRVVGQCPLVTWKTLSTLPATMGKYCLWQPHHILLCSTSWWRSVWQRRRGARILQTLRRDRRGYILLLNHASALVPAAHTMRTATPLILNNAEQIGTARGFTM